MTSGHAAITVEDVGKSYRLGAQSPGLFSDVVGSFGRKRGDEEPDPDVEFWAVRNISLEVQPGEVVGLIGRNGAGKSTLLKLLSNITYPTEGRIRLRGKVGTLLEVGTGFHPALNGRENIYLAGTILGMKRREIHARYDEIVEFSGIERFIETPVRRYSSGMYVRLGFAVAAHLSPEILLVDEVLAVGDAEFQQKCLAKMRDVVGEGRTVVFVSHNLASVQRLCDRSYWIEHGGVAAAGPTDDVVASYLKAVATQQSGGVVVIGDGVDRVGSGTARVSRVELVGGLGEPTDHLHLGEPLSLRIGLDAREVVSDAMLEVGISSTDGNRIVTAMNVDAGREPARLDVGSHAFQVDLAVALLPGDFTVDVGIHHLNEVPIDYVSRVMTFTVSKTGYEKGQFHPVQAVRGSVRADSTWTRR